MEATRTRAIGVDLHLVGTAEGGRETPLVGGSDAAQRFRYRPNWGLPGWAEGDQASAPVLGFSRSDIWPGEDARAIIVPLFPERVLAWGEIAGGDVLYMYEGARICGRGVVAWVEPTRWPMENDEADRLAEWLID